MCADTIKTRHLMVQNKTRMMEPHINEENDEHEQIVSKESSEG